MNKRFKKFINKKYPYFDEASIHFREAIEEAFNAGEKEFYAEACKRAERKMLKTGKLEGAHFASMKEMMEENKHE